MRLKRLTKTVFDGKQLFYTDIGYGSDIHFRLWVDQQLVKEQDKDWYIEFPVINCVVIQLENCKDLIVKPGKSNLFYFELETKFNEKNTIDSIDADQPYQVFKYANHYSVGALIFTKANKVRIKWHKDNAIGDKMLKEEGVTLLYNNGKRETIPNDEVLKYL